MGVHGRYGTTARAVYTREPDLTPIDEPTLGEVLRRIDSLTAQVINLVAELKEDRISAAKTFVRQDVHVRERQMIEANISDIRTDIVAVDTKNEARLTKIDDRFDRLESQQKIDADKRRQVWLTIAGLFITVVLGIAALIVNIVQG